MIHTRLQNNTAFVVAALLLSASCHGSLAASMEETRIRKKAEAGAEQKARLADLEKLGVKGVLFSERHPGRDPQKHYYVNFGYACTDENEWLHGANGGRLAVLVPATGEVKTLFSDPKGAVRDPCVHYSGEKILFSYRKGGAHYYNLYEINVDGSGLRQITKGDWDDVEPAYLPDGGIVFCSSRCKRYVLCWLAPVAVLFRCDADGGNMRQLSSNTVTENTPCVLPDGRILYTRWEYVNRDPISFHHLWTMNPDGCGQRAFFGNMHRGGVFIDAQPIPGSKQIAYIHSGYHGQLEHAGDLKLLDPSNGPDDRASSKTLLKGDIRDPLPISTSLFLAARGSELIQVDDEGNVHELYSSSMMVHEPRVLAPRQREQIIPSAVDLSMNSGTLFLADVNIGRNMKGVKPGSIKKLLIMESLAKPANFHGGGSTPIGHGGTWTLKRILGTVPVEVDGSAFFEAPAGRSIYFVAIDENDLCVKQMRSFVTLQPGENVSCVGCHEDRLTAAPSGNRMAGQRTPSQIKPVAGVPEIFDFPRDIQPILDRHCVECHDAEKREGGVELTGDRGPAYSISYYNLMLFRQISDGAGWRWSGLKNCYGRPIGNDTPYTTFSYASPLMKKIDGSHHDVKLTAEEQKTVRLWIDSAANYAGTYASYGTGQIGGWWRSNQAIREMDDDWPSTAPARDAVTRRCASCHEDRMPKSVTDLSAIERTEGDMEGWQRSVSRFSRHTIFNLSRPENSMALRIPLAKQAGGFAEGKMPSPKPVPSDVSSKPKPFTHPVIYESKEDPDYQRMLAHLKAAGKRLNEIKRFDMPGFKPRSEYVREMKRYGILPKSFDVKKHPVNVYALEQAYWRLFHNGGDNRALPFLGAKPEKHGL